MIRYLLMISVVLLLLEGAPFTSTQAGFSTTSATNLNAGGTLSTGGVYTLFSSTGQVGSIGTSTSITYAVVDGFVGVASSIPGDFDDDGVVGLLDFGFFIQCFRGPNNPPPAAPPGCENADLDMDGDVDLEDFRIFVGHVG